MVSSAVLSSLLPPQEHKAKAKREMAVRDKSLFFMVVFPFVIVGFRFIILASSSAPMRTGEGGKKVAGTRAFQVILQRASGRGRGHILWMIIFRCLKM